MRLRTRVLFYKPGGIVIVDEHVSIENVQVEVVHPEHVQSLSNALSQLTGLKVEITTELEQ